MLFLSFFFFGLVVPQELLWGLFFFAWFLYHFSPNSVFIVKTHFRPARKIYSFLNRKWFFDKIFNEYVSQFFLKLSFSISYKFMDRGIFEMLGPTGLAVLFTNVSNTVHKLHSGHLYHSNLIILMFSQEMKRLIN